MKKYSTEFIGTFFWVLTMVLASNDPGIAPMAPMAIGAILLAMVFAGGHISGAHFNPAVTFAVYMRGKIDMGEAMGYVITQLLASICAASIGVYLHGAGAGAEIALHSNPDPFSSVLAELLGTFALAYVVLNVSTTESNTGNSYHGVAIGFTVMAGAYAFGAISGGALNPAVAIGACVAGMFASTDLWIYLVGTLGGAAAAATVFSGIYGRGA